MTCQIETGVQLFARLNARPSLTKLYPVIFENDGPYPGEIIEIVGDVSCAKTILLTELISHAILPSEYNNHHIGGKNAAVILIDTEHHFDLFQLNNIIVTKLKSLSNQTIQLTETDIESILKGSLKRLTIFNVYSLTELWVTFHKIGELLSENAQISMICIDSISSYYWWNRDFAHDKIYHKDYYQQTILDDLHNVIKYHKIVVAFTKPLHFVSKNICTAKSRRSKPADYKIYLSENKSRGLFAAAISNSITNHFVRHFEISSVIEWMQASV